MKIKDLETVSYFLKAFLIPSHASKCVLCLDGSGYLGFFQKYWRYLIFLLKKGSRDCKVSQFHGLKELKCGHLCGLQKSSVWAFFQRMLETDTPQHWEKGVLSVPVGTGLLLRQLFLKFLYWPKDLNNYWSKFYNPFVISRTLAKVCSDNCLTWRPRFSF